jgi:hypothetical protein
MMVVKNMKKNFAWAQARVLYFQMSCRIARVTKIENNSDEARTRLFIDFFVVDPKSPLNEDDDERGIKESLEVALERREKIRSELHKCQVGWGYTMYGNCGSVEFIDNKSILRNYSNCGGDYTELLSGNLSNEDN